jgi:methyl-accepting chemotaxis protein
MDIYNYLQKDYNFEINKQYELTENIRNDICIKFDMTKDKLGKDLGNNLHLFEYTKQKKQFNNNRIWIYYIKLITIQEVQTIEIQDDKFETIHNYLGLEFIMLKYNRYVNITKLCASTNKKYSNYTRTSNYREIYKSLTEEGISEPSIEILDVSNHLKGTYVHEELAIAVSTWISVEFFRKVTKIISNYMKDKYERELRIKEDKIDVLCKNIQDLQVTNNKILETNKNLEESNKNLEVTNNKILETNKNLEESNNKILETNKNLEDINNKQSEDIKKLLSNSNQLLEQNKTTQEKLDKINNLLETLKENIIPEDDWSVFLIYKISDSEYHVVRTMSKYLNKRKKEFREYRKLYEFTLPSSIQYFSSFRDEYKDKLDIKRNTIELKEKNERELLLYIKKHYASILKIFIDSKQY